MAINLKKVLDVPESLDKRSSEALIKALKDHYVQEFDYIKFTHSVQSLIEMGMDEQTAFKSAFMTAKTMGFTKELYLKSSRHYLKILSDQRESFADALKRQRSEKISGRLDSKESYKERLQKNLDTIEKLKLENTQLTEKLAKFEESLKIEKEKLEEVTEKFVNSYEHFDSKIKQDIELFEKYI